MISFRPTEDVRNAVVLLIEIGLYYGGYQEVGENEDRES
jgi:hypothetical protein